MVPQFGVVAIDGIGAGVILPLLPFYAQRIGATPFLIGALVASYSLCQAIASPWLGRLSDSYGRKPVLMASQLGTLAGLVLFALAGHLWLLFIARMIDGVTAGNISTASAMAVDHSTPTTRKQAIGVISAALGLGIMAGPGLSALRAQVSITAPIWAAAVLSAASVVTTSLMLPSDAPQSNPPQPVLYCAGEPGCCESAIVCAGRADGVGDVLRRLRHVRLAARSLRAGADRLERPYTRPERDRRRVHHRGRQQHRCTARRHAPSRASSYR